MSQTSGDAYSIPESDISPPSKAPSSKWTPLNLKMSLSSLKKKLSHGTLPRLKKSPYTQGLLAPSPAPAAPLSTSVTGASSKKGALQAQKKQQSTSSMATTSSYLTSLRPANPLPRPFLSRVVGAQQSTLSNDASSDNSDLSDSSSSSDNSATPKLLLLIPDSIFDEDGFEIDPDPGQTIDHDKIDHHEYLRLGELLDEFGWLQSVYLAYSQEYKVSSEFMKQCTTQHWLLAADSMLLAMEESVIKANSTRDGNLNQLATTDPVVAKVLQDNEKRSDEKKHPAIYVRALTHDQSQGFQAFTVEEAESIARHALAYAEMRDEQTKLAYTIDRAHNPGWQKSWTRSGSRFFLQIDKVTNAYGKINDARRRNLTTFAQALFKNAKESRSLNRPTVPVMHYVGYAVNAATRKKQHAAGGSNSSWLTQCVLTIAKASNMTTYITSHTVCLVSEETAGPVAEMLLSRIARAYCFAGGFSVGQAGASMKSIRAEKLSDKQRREWWGSHIEYMKKTEYPRRVRREMHRRRHLQESEVVKERSAMTNEYSAFTQQATDEKHVYDESVAGLGDAAAQQWMRTFAPDQMEMFDKNRGYLELKATQMAQLR